MYELLYKKQQKPIFYNWLQLLFFCGSGTSKVELIVKKKEPETPIMWNFPPLRIFYAHLCNSNPKIPLQSVHSTFLAFFLSTWYTTHGFEQYYR